MENQLELTTTEASVSEKKGAAFSRVSRKHVVMASAVFLIAAALVLNFLLFGDKLGTTDPTVPTEQEESADTTPTDTSTDGYFSATQVSRQRARDEALEVLQSVVDNENSDEAAKTGALQEIAALASAMEAEANIESLVISKGFAQCVAVINKDVCSVVVSGSELTPAEIAQINEIVYEQASIKPENVRIITK